MDSIKIGSHIDEEIRAAVDARGDKSLEQRQAEAVRNIKTQENVQKLIGEKGLNLIRILDKSGSLEDLKLNVAEVKKLAKEKAMLRSNGALMLLDYAIDVVTDAIDKPSIAEWKEEHEIVKKDMRALRETLRQQLHKPRK